MENSNTVSCQTCLGQLELPTINLFESSYSELLDVLQRLLAFQVYTEGSEFFVCQQCQRKLRWITEFQNICLKSLEPLRNDVKYIKTEQSSFLAGHNSDDNLPIPSLVWNAGFTGLKSPRFDDDCDSTKHESTVPKQETGKLKIRKQRRVKRSAARGSKIRADSLEKQIRSADKAEVELNLQDVDEDDDRSCSLFGDGSDSDNDYHQTKGSNKKRKRQNKEITRQKDYSKKFLAAAVLQAIKQLDSRQTDLKNRQCVFCDYISSTFAMLKSHVIKKHKDFINNWCENCNSRVEDLQEHRDEVGCHFWLCRFCDKEQHTAKRLREHFKICPKGRYAVANYISDIADVNNDIADVNNDITDVSKEEPIKSSSKRKRNYRIRRIQRSEVLQAIKEVNSYKLDIKNRRCLFCDFVGEKSGSLQTHMTYIHRNVTKENNWCRHCNTQVDDLQSHKDTMRCHLWTCKFCKGWGVPAVSDLLKHLKTHGGIRPVTQYPKDLLLHAAARGMSCAKRVEDNSLNSHLCALCGKVFKTIRNLKDHSCGSAEKLFKCPICDRCYRSPKLLRCHRVLHGSFVCQICGKRSSSKSCHWTHMKIHEAGGPVQCTICDKTFVRPGRLKVHMKEHTGDNQCMVCDKSFSVKWMLINHMRVHNEERPFKCSHCGRGFNDKRTCIRHEYTHTGEKPFKCLICPYSAVNTFHLTTHMKQHPEDAPQASKPFKCPFCHRSFSTNTVLVSHTRLVHGRKLQ